MNEPLYSNHHIIPRSRNGHPKNEQNIVRMSHKKHKAIHRLFGNMKPHEQIEHLLHLYDPALHPKFVKNMLHWMQVAKNNGWVYKKGVYRRS